MNKQGILEGLLFVVGDDGLTLKQISELLDEDIDTCKEILLSLKQSYEAENNAISPIPHSIIAHTGIHHSTFLNFFIFI